MPSRELDQWGRQESSLPSDLAFGPVKLAAKLRRRVGNSRFALYSAPLYAPPVLALGDLFINSGGLIRAAVVGGAFWAAEGLYHRITKS